MLSLTITILPTNAPFNDFPELFKRYVEKINSNADYTQHEDVKTSMLIQLHLH
jgi:hypothetical protein